MFTDDMPLLASVILIAHFALLFVLALFGAHRLSIVVRWFRYRNYEPTVKNQFAVLPKVTVQVPMYNERYVAGRIVDTVAALDYPSDRLQIQIVDDSNDETTDIVAKAVRCYQDQGVNIQHIQRSNRRGYKAGALRDAMATATGEFIAIFDADFVPEPSLLLDTIHHFTDSRIGMVQFRWEHLNRFNSSLTSTQAVMLDAHFSLEQQVRCASGALLNFNGTAGIWRTGAIVDAGHWSADTLTEDLDLSYRAQLKGWRMLYLNHITCSGEIPSDANALKSQQHRWAKGGIQVMLKILGTVWRSPRSLGDKVESTFHLSNNLAYFLVLTNTLFFLIPSLLIRETYQLESLLWLDITLLMLSSGGHLVYFIFGQIALGYPVWRTLIKIPSLLLLGIQLAFNNARAALEALAGRKSGFVRTPKSGELEKNIRKALEQRTISRSLYQAVPPRGVLLESALSITYAVVLCWAVLHELWFMLPFLLLLIIGFATTAMDTWRSQQKINA